MWESCQFLLVIVATTLFLLFNSTNLPKFALYSELVWLSVYLLVCLLGSFVDSIELLSAPFIILVLTAVEAVIVWLLVVYSTTS